MKSILRSIKPYWFYLICEGKKIIEVAKTAPEADDWDKITYLYCSKDKKSFNRIPKEYQEKYIKYLGKVGARFICNYVEECISDYNPITQEFFYNEWEDSEATCLTAEEQLKYGKGKPLYGLHISELKIYDKPRELGEFVSCKYYHDGECFLPNKTYCKHRVPDLNPDGSVNIFECKKRVTRPPQSWCYVERG